MIEILSREWPSVMPLTGGALPNPDDLSGLAGALQRALPFTRLTDYGMADADARELLWRTASGEDWVEIATLIGDRQTTRAVQSRDGGRLATAREAALAALAVFNVAQIAYNLDSPEKSAAYERFQVAVALFASLDPEHVQRVDLDYADGQVAGWLFLPESARADGCVVMWGGLSGWGASYVSAAKALTERNLACILAEGPGQGTPRLRHGLYGTSATLPGYARFVDFALQDERLGGSVGIQGNSFGGLMAARVAAADTRIRACIVNGASAAPTVPEFRSAREQIFAFTGTSALAAATQTLSELSFDPVEHRIAAPCLVLRGGADPLVSEPQQRQFLDGMPSARSEFLVWPDGEHTLYNHAAERDAITADWFRTHLTTAAHSWPDG